MLLGRNPEGARRAFAEAEKSAKLVSEDGNSTKQLDFPRRNNGKGLSHNWGLYHNVM